MEASCAVFWTTVMSSEPLRYIIQSQVPGVAAGVAVVARQRVERDLDAGLLEHGDHALGEVLVGLRSRR